MASTTLIRVKRRRSQSPAEALLVHLAPKRPREDGKSEASEAGHESEPKSKIFRFATTVTDPEKAADEKSLCQFVGNKVSEQKLETPVRTTKHSRTPVKEKHHPPAAAKLVDKSKEALSACRSESRFKVVATRRNLDVDELDDDNLFHLLDIIQEDWKEEPKLAEKKIENVDKISCNGVELEVEKGKIDDFVYDVYYHHRNQAAVKSGDVEFFSPESIDQVEKIDRERALELYQLEMNDLFSFQDDRDLEAFGEDSDSNDESNWRNEYPDDDEEEVLSDDYDEFGFCASGGGGRRGRVALADEDGDSDLDERFGNLGVRGDDGEDLSDDAEDELVYSKTFERDANLHGSDYAKYKQKILARDYYFEERSPSESENEDDDLAGEI